MSKRKYYDFFDDEALYPDAVVYIIVSPRGVGKTYGVLDGARVRGKKIIYMKRTIDDVNTICTSDELADINPYKPINRDKGCKVIPQRLKKGLGYFKDISCGEDDAYLVAYLAALNALKTIRGVDFSDADYCVLDEFVPTIGDNNVKRKPGASEGDQLLDCYMTFERDREDRTDIDGNPLKPIKLILLSNSDDIMSPIAETFEVVDIISEMSAKKQRYYYDPDRLLMVHLITDEEYPVTDAQKRGIYATMKNTDWARKAFGGAFVNNDFSQIDKKTIKHSRCIMSCKYKNKTIYVYENYDNNHLYFCDIPHQTRVKYDFNKDSDRIRYLHFDNMTIRSAIMNNQTTFQTYSMYDLFINFVKKFALN